MKQMDDGALIMNKTHTIIYIIKGRRKTGEDRQWFEIETIYTCKREALNGLAHYSRTGAEHFTYRLYRRKIEDVEILPESTCKTAEAC